MAVLRFRRQEREGSHPVRETHQPVVGGILVRVQNSVCPERVVRDEKNPAVDRMAIDAAQGKNALRRVPVHHRHGAERRHPQNIHRQCDDYPQKHFRATDLQRTESRRYEIRVDLHVVSTQRVSAHLARNRKHFPARQNQRDNGMFHGREYPAQYRTVVGSRGTNTIRSYQIVFVHRTVLQPTTDQP